MVKSYPLPEYRIKHLQTTISLWLKLGNFFFDWLENIVEKDQNHGGNTKTPTCAVDQAGTA